MKTYKERLRKLYGFPGAIPLVEERVANHTWENSIRTTGVVNACEWMGHAPDSVFTMDTINYLMFLSGMSALLTDEEVVEAISLSGEPYCQACGTDWEEHHKTCSGMVE